MSAMDDYVDVTVTRGGGQVASGRYKLPVTFGRLAQNPVRLGAEPPDKSVSRTHASVELVGGQLRLIDRSTNGTLHAGRLLHNGETADLSDDDRFQIRDYEIHITRARRDPSIPVSFAARVSVRGEVLREDLSIGEMMVLCVESSEGQLLLEPVPTTGDTKLETFVARYRLNGETLLAAIIAREGQGVLQRFASTEGPQMRLNRDPVTGSRIKLKPLDVVEIGDARIELLRPGEKGLVCSNSSCQLLNEYKPLENCRWCGHKLVHGTTVIVKPSEPVS